VDLETPVDGIDGLFEGASTVAQRVLRKLLVVEVQNVKDAKQRTVACSVRVGLVLLLRESGCLEGSKRHDLVDSHIPGDHFAVENEIAYARRKCILQMPGQRRVPIHEAVAVEVAVVFGLSRPEAEPHPARVIRILNHVHLHTLAIQLFLDPKLGVLFSDAQQLNHPLKRRRHLELGELRLEALHQGNAGLLLLEAHRRIV